MRGGRPSPITVGGRFGRLRVLGLDPSYTTGLRRFVCRCDCGTEVVRLGASLRVGRATSCGCGRVQHGHSHGSPTYKTWDAMRQRCMNPRSKDYPNWGGRGITICDEWRDSFSAFLRDMGHRPAGRTLGRIDNDGPYCKANCRWETSAEQAASRRTTLRPEVRERIRAEVAGGLTQTAVAKRHGIRQSTVSRIVNGRRDAPSKGV